MVGSLGGAPASVEISVFCIGVILTRAVLVATDQPAVPEAGSMRAASVLVTAIGDNEEPNMIGTVDIGGTVVTLASFYAHTCVILATNAVRCWGRNFDGQLGYGNTLNIGDNELPSSVGNVPFL